mgnify:CR=1 FL=1
MITEKYFNSIEKIILIILLIATVSAIAQEIIQVIELGEVYLADILLLFIFSFFVYPSVQY